jgi:hypothetical protein
VRFEIVQPIAAEREAVIKAVIDRRFYESIGSTKGLAPPSVLECWEDGESKTDSRASSQERREPCSTRRR